MKALVHMPQQNEYEQRVFFSETPERLTAALLLILANLGWDNLDVCGFGLTAQIMSEKNVSPSDCLTAVVTCIPHRSSETELLLTVCSHQGVSSQEKAILILNELARHVAAHNHEGVSARG